uniref:Uncharacterized protein n=1 Tax=Tetradesmus obliquus TaxID=3088 RepID=A0A383W9V3_TETOB|eukprot:jgi/Sobl393_1/2796/SZX73879.1
MPRNRSSSRTSSSSSSSSSAIRSLQLPQKAVVTRALQPHTYGGHCTCCGGEHWLDCTPEAAEQARQLLATIHSHGRLDFDCAQPDPRFDLDMLFTKGPGRMIGVLVAVDSQGSSHVLKAFSGQITETWHIPGWVGPVAGITNSSPLYVRTRAVIERCSARLAQLEQAAGGKQHHRKQKQQQQQQQQMQPATPGNQTASSSSSSSGVLQQFLQEQQQLLKRRRKRLSHGLLEQIQHSYSSSTVAGQPLSLLDVYLQYTRQYNPALPVTRAGQFVGMPAGAGDCCAPKLLHAAAAAGLTPTGLTEVWCGSAPGTATKAKMGRPITDNGLDPSSSRLHMQFYGMCDKCQALLGSMLCTASCGSSSTVSSSSSSSSNPNCSTVSCSMKGGS